MRYMVMISAVLGGVGMIATGAHHALDMFISGTPIDQYTTPLQEVITGLAIFSPGVQGLKVGAFRRPAA